MGTYITEEQLKDKIFDTYRTLLDYGAEQRGAKARLRHELEKLPEFGAVERAKDDTKAAREKLSQKINEDDALSELAEEVVTANNMVDAAKSTLSTLLVRQTVESKNASAQVTENVRRQVILKATLGDEAPDQLELFED